MSDSGLTAGAIKQQHLAEIAESNTFEPQGLSVQNAKDYLDTDEGAMYWWRVAQASPQLSSSEVDERAIKQLVSGRDLPRMVTIETGKALAKFVADGSSPSAHSPFWAFESEACAAEAAGRNISDYFGLPIGSEAPRYGMYRMTPAVPTQVFINTVAPTSELNGLVTKAGGAEQVLVPNRQLFNTPVYVRSVDNLPGIAAEVQRGAVPPHLARGVGVLGVAAVAYETGTTAADTSELLHQDNLPAAQSEVLHFGSSNLGLLGGLLLGAETGAALGWETGPGVLATTTLGSIAGAVAGDKLADAIDNHRIGTQTDREGRDWHYDPAQPAKGWTRTVESNHADLSPGDYRLQGFAHPRQVLTATPELADEFNYRASGVAVQLALDHVPRPGNPYAQPAGPDDTPSLRPVPWFRDARSHEWYREVVTGMLEHGMLNRHVETAPPERAAALDQAAEAVVEDNLAHSGRAMAHRYLDAWAANGWSRFGPPPEAVSRASRAPGNELQASDGHLYTRSPDGQWTTPGRLYGSNPASGNVRDELDATWRRARHSPGFMEAQASAATPGTVAHPAPISFSDPAHPQHALYARLKELLPAQTSEARLAQATSACHASRITAENLGHIHIDGQAMVFAASWPPGITARADLTRPPPAPEQSAQLAPAFDPWASQQAQPAQRESPRNMSFG